MRRSAPPRCEQGQGTLGTRDGDVFIQTWATVAASNKDARKVRRTSEAALSFDDLIASWRDADFFIGVVIDEAHLNFGASASVAARFYLTIQPDFTDPCHRDTKRREAGGV